MRKLYQFCNKKVNEGYYHSYGYDKNLKRYWLFSLISKDCDFIYYTKTKKSIIFSCIKKNHFRNVENLNNFINKYKKIEK